MTSQTVEQQVSAVVTDPERGRGLLHVVPSMNPATGGMPHGIRSVSPEIDELGTHSEVVCLDDATDDYGVSDPVVVHRLGTGRGPWGYSNRLQPWLSQNASRYHAVIIHGLWQYHSYQSARTLLQFRRQRSTASPRVYVMPHGMLDPWFQRDPSRRLKAYRNWVYWKAIESRVVSRSDGVLFTCQRELELARETFRPYTPAKEINVGYGIQKPPQASPEQWSAFLKACSGIANRPYLLFLSRIHAKKGVDLLLHAYAQVTSRRNWTSAVPALVIAGPKESAYARQMQSLAEQLGLLHEPGEASEHKPAVYFPGMLRGDAKWGAIHNCDAFILPSHQENFGIAVAEALGCGRPVLISDQINIWKEIQSEAAGIVEDDTEDGTCRLIERWLEQTDGQRATLAESGKRCFQRHFTVDAYARNLFNATIAESDTK